MGNIKRWGSYSKVYFFLLPRSSTRLIAWRDSKTEFPLALINQSIWYIRMLYWFWLTYLQEDLQKKRTHVYKIFLENNNNCSKVINSSANHTKKSSDADWRLTLNLTQLFTSQLRLEGSYFFSSTPCNAKLFLLLDSSSLVPDPSVIWNDVSDRKCSVLSKRFFNSSNSSWFLRRAT